LAETARIIRSRFDLSEFRAGTPGPTPDAFMRCINALMSVLRVAAGVMLVASVGINFANIIGRYIFAVSIPWAEEAMLFLMIGCVFLGAGPVGYLGRHIRMDVVVLALPPRARKFFEIFSDLVTIATCIMLAIFAWPVVSMLAELNERSDTANIPLAIPQSALPIGLLLMALLIAVRLVVHGPGRSDIGPGQGSGH
jgi:TRAP-type C4-dicarboxylate transport system permease small subunit